MNLSEETDINKLKAITLDELDKIAVAEHNVKVLRERIAQLQEIAASKPAEAVKPEKVSK